MRCTYIFYFVEEGLCSISKTNEGIIVWQVKKKTKDTYDINVKTLINFTKGTSYRSTN
jgi:hypothetical protein